MMTAGLLPRGRRAPRGADQVGRFTRVKASPAQGAADSWELHLLLGLPFLPLCGSPWLCPLMCCLLFLPRAPLLGPAAVVPGCPLCSGCPGERVRGVLGHTDALLMIHFISCAQEDVAGGERCS